MNKKINQLGVRTAVGTDLALVGDPTTGTSYKTTFGQLPLVPYTGATGAVSLGLFGLTAGTLTLQEQPLNGSTYKLTQRMASNDYWSIYGFASVADYGDLYFELQDNAAFADGQRFRFHYGNDSSGTPKDILVMDYNSATIDGTVQVNTLAGTGTRMVISDANGALSTQAIPSTSSGGSSVNYYLNGSVNSSVAGYKQLGNTATIGAGTDFTLSGNGLIAQFLTDAGNPNRLEIPGGAWNFEMFFQVSSSGGNQKFYVELLKYDGTTFTSIASSSAIPEQIAGGTAIDLYLTSLAVPTTTLLVTDRLAIRVYIVDNSGGRTITLHTEDNTLCEIITNFAGGISALNGLTANTQYFATGTSGTSFNIVSVGDTHTFNFPAGGGGMAIGGSITSATAGSVLFAGTSGVLAQDNANFFWDDTNNRLGIGTASPSSKFEIQGITSNDAAVLGSELTTTGSGANWAGSGFATGYTHTIGSTAALTTSLAAINNSYYQLTWTITGRTAGTFVITFGGYTSAALSGSSNANAITSSTGTLTITPTSTFDGTIVLSVKLITPSTAMISFKNSGGTITNEFRGLTQLTNVSIGKDAGANSLSIATNNIFIGTESGKYNKDGRYNTAIGYRSLYLANGNYNTAIGYNIFTSMFGGGSNTGVGQNILINAIDSSDNNAFGSSALTANISNNNCAFGSSALTASTSGFNQAAFGYRALFQTTTGQLNQSFGARSLYNNTTGGNNTAFGYKAGETISGGSSANTITDNSIYIGYDTRALASGQTNQIVIGYQETGLGSNTTIIGNSSTITTALRGRLLLGTTTDSGSYQLDVNGTARVSGDMTVNASLLFNTTMPSRHTATAYPAIFVGNSNSSVMSETGAGYKGIYLAANIVRSVALNRWVCQDTTQAAWFLGLNYDNLTDEFTLLRTAATSGEANFVKLFSVKGTTGNISIGLGATAATALTDIGASTTTRASLRIRSGTAPTTPNDGDIWYDGTDLKMRIGGVTKTFTLV